MSSVSFVLFALIAMVICVQANVVAPAVPCFTDDNCKNALGNQVKTRCIQNTCMCLPDLKTAYEPCRLGPSPRAGSPVTPLVGRTCVNGTDCNLKNGICNRLTKTCSCENGYVSANGNSECLEAVNELERSCQRTEQCASVSSHSECVDGKCQCEKGYHQASKTKCLKIIGLGASCQSEEETCFAASDKDVSKNVLRCSTDLHKCECEKAYKEVNGLCELASGARQIAINLIPTLMMLIVSLCLV